MTITELLGKGVEDSDGVYLGLVDAIVECVDADGAQSSWVVLQTKDNGSTGVSAVPYELLSPASGSDVYSSTLAKAEIQALALPKELTHFTTDSDSPDFVIGDV